MRNERCVGHVPCVVRTLKRTFELAALFVALGTLPHSVNATTLSEAVNTALSTNPQIARADANSRAAGYDVRQARGGYLPSVDVNSSVGWESSDIKQLSQAGVNQDPLTARQFALTLRQMLFDGFATRHEVDRRLALLSAAEYNATDTRETIAFKTVQVYLDVLANTELVRLAEQNVDAHERIVKNVRLKAERGVGQMADVEQAQGRMALAESILTARRGALDESRTNYQRLVGQLPSDLQAPESVQSGLLLAGKVNESALEATIKKDTAEALHDHPSMQQVRAELKAAQAAARAAKASYFPRLDLETSLTRNDNVSGVQGINNSDSVMLVGRWNLYNGGADRAQERASIERRLSAEQGVEDTQRAVEENVAIALKAKAASEGRIPFLKQHVAASKASLEAYRAQFELGRRTLLDLLNAETELFTARSDLTSGIYDDLKNQYFIDAAMGRLVQSLTANSAQR